MSRTKTKTKAKSRKSPSLTSLATSKVHAMITSPRVTERDLVVPTLELLSRTRGNYVSTSDLIYYLAQLLDPMGLDDTILRKRRDTYFSQKVRNLVCHRNNYASFLNAASPTYMADYVINPSTKEGGIKLRAPCEALPHKRA